MFILILLFIIPVIALIVGISIKLYLRPKKKVIEKTNDEKTKKPEDEIMVGKYSKMSDKEIFSKGGRRGPGGGHLQFKEKPKDLKKIVNIIQLLKQNAFLGFFTEIRGRFAYLPEDVRLKKLAGNLLMMGQSGLYNYERCIARKETAAAQMAVFEFAKSAVNVIFLLNKTYMTYYKWVFKAMRNLAVLSESESSVEHIISSPNDEMEVKVKIKIIEELCKDIVAELKKQKITDYCGEEMEGHAYSANNKIKNEEIRNLHILRCNRQNTQLLYTDLHPRDLRRWCM